MHVPPRLRRIYTEVIDRYDGGQHLLCAAGIRSVIESICVDLGIERVMCEESLARRSKERAKGCTSEAFSRSRRPVSCVAIAILAMSPARNWRHRLEGSWSQLQRF